MKRLVYSPTTIPRQHPKDGQQPVCKVVLDQCCLRNHIKRLSAGHIHHDHDPRCAATPSPITALLALTLTLTLTLPAACAFMQVPPSPFAVLMDQSPERSPACIFVESGVSGSFLQDSAPKSWARGEIGFQHLPDHPKRSRYPTTTLLRHPTVPLPHYHPQVSWLLGSWTPAQLFA
jgi:hypothetical protein